MLKYGLQRLITTIPVLLGVTVLVFSLMHLVPGDPVKAMFRATGESVEIPPEVYESIRKQYGFDKPVPVQYLIYMGRLFQGDMGRSTIRNRPVTELIRQNWRFTAELALTAITFAIVFGVLLGVVAAVNRGGWWDTLSMLAATFGVSMPNFWFGLMAMLVFAIQLGWLPASGVGGFKFVILPALTLGISAAAIIARLTRSSLLEALGEDYVRTARAKGVRERRVTFIHALRNSLIPVVTLIGLQFGSLLAGAVVSETVFARRGLGSLTLEAVTSKDFPLAQGLILIIALIYVVVNIIVDMLYAALDPRIQYS
jgi:peptide/nickel transport system permease protein